MQNFVFENPTKIIFGQGTIVNIGREVKRFGRRALLVYGRAAIKKTGVYDQVVGSLREAGVEIVELPGVRSNPLLSKAKEGIELARERQADVILAVGGGSVIDTAKTIAAGVKADHDPWEFFVYTKVVRDALPLLVVLTLSASASEMNPAAVITKDDTRQKYSVRSPLLQPKTSILDPTVLYTVSPAYTAYSAVDVVTHLLEGYFNNSEPGESFLQDRMVYAFLETVREATGKSLENPKDYEARANFMWAATLGFNGLTTAGMGAVSFPAHMIEHSLSALYDIAHGAGLSIVLPGWMTWASRKNPARFADFARHIFSVTERDDSKAAAVGIARLKAWFAAIGSPVSLKEGGIPDEDIQKIATHAAMLAQTWRLKDYTREAIAEVLDCCRSMP